MININLLEQKWFNYKFKKILLLNIFLILVLLVTLILYMYLFLFKKDFLHNTMKKISSILIFNEEKTKKNIINQPININRKYVDINIIKKEITKKLEQDNIEKKIMTSSKNIESLRKPYTPDKIKVDEKNKKTFNIVMDNKNFIFHMTKRFKDSKNPHIALTLANHFFSKKDYYRSGYWALTANKIDRRLDESWIIFAKSKVKLGKKTEALRLLKSYYQNNPSSSILILINNIQSNSLF